MKKISTKIISIILSITLVFSGFTVVTASAESDFGDVMTHVGVSALEGLIRGIIGGLNLIVPDSLKFQKMKDYESKSDEDKLFFRGTEIRLDKPAEGAAWELGYSKASLVPEELKKALLAGDKNYGKENEYYLGGFMTFDNLMTNNIEELVDDMEVRVIAIADGSGRGTSVFANVDCIGFCHGDLLTARQKFIALCKENGISEKTINAVNLTSTHCHSCIDTQGLWTNALPKILGNLFKSYLPFLSKEDGVNTEWMDFATSQIAKAMYEAATSMEKGDLTYAYRTINSDYFNNKNRKSSTSHCYDIYRFEFKPFDGSKGTMIVNMNAHPDVTGLATGDEADNGRQLSGDYVAAMEDVIEAANYNFMFFQGAIAGIYYGRGLSGDGIELERRYQQAQRYGTEIGYIVLSMCDSYADVKAKYEDIINKEIEDEIAKRPDYDPKSYSPFYDTPAFNEATKKNDLEWDDAPHTASPVTLDPVFNLTLREVKIEVRNPLMKLVGKLDLVHYDVYKENLKYNMFGEIGLAEFGNVKVACMPGEVVQDLVYGGGSLTAEGSFSGKDFGYKTIRELFGEDTIVFGIFNDAIGYVVPDNDYSLGIVDDHYQELISLGDRTASAILGGFADLAEELNK